MKTAPVTKGAALVIIINMKNGMPVLYLSSTPVVGLWSLCRFSLSSMEVWRHTEEGCVRDRTLEGQR